MTRVAVAVLVDVPGDVADPVNVAEHAVRSAIRAYGATSPDSLPATDVLLQDNTVARCEFSAVGEVNLLMRSHLLKVGPTGR